MHQNNKSLDEDIDLIELFQLLWSKKRLIIQITIIAAATSVLIALLQTTYYKSSSVITVNNGDNQNQGLLAQYGGLTSMIGVNLPTAGGNKTQEAIELIRSRKFVAHLLTFEGILPSIMAAKSYDASTGKLSFDESLYDSELNVWRNKSKKNGPSYLQAHRAYKKLITISEDKKTGFILIEIEHISPVFAKEFLELIIKESNALLRERDLELSSQALQYLKSELSKTPLVSIQESINTLIESQLETQMLARINEDYVLIEIDPPFVPDRKSKPNRSLILILGTLLGGLLSIIFILVRHYFFERVMINKNMN